MRKTILIVLVAVVAGGAWVAWPLTTLHALASAVEARNVAAIADRIDPVSLRGSLNAQIIEAYSRVSGAKLDRSQVVAAVAGSFADPLIAALVSPQGIALLLNSGWFSAEPAERPSGAEGLSTQALGDTWRIFRDLHWGLDRYSVSFPADQPETERFELELRLRGVTWRLAAIRLPQRLADRLAEQIVRVQRGR